MRLRNTPVRCIRRSGNKDRFLPDLRHGPRTVVVTADTGASHELADMTKRFWVALILSVPVFVLEMGSHLFPALHDVVPPRVSTWIQLVLATPVVLWAGWPFFVRGWNSIRTRSLNMFTLIAMGTGVAWVYSVVATLAPGIFPDEFRQMDAPSPCTSRPPP